MCALFTSSVVTKNKLCWYSEEKVIDFIESKVQDKLQAFDRRVQLRKTVEDA